MCSALILLQLFGLLLFLGVRGKTKHPVFESNIHFVSYFLIMFTVFILAIDSLILQEWHTREYKVFHRLSLEAKTTSPWLAYTVITLIISSILTELLKAFVSTCNFYKATKSVKHKIHLGISSSQLINFDQYILTEHKKLISDEPKKKTDNKKSLKTAKAYVPTSKRIRIQMKRPIRGKALRIPVNINSSKHPKLRKKDKTPLWINLKPSKENLKSSETSRMKMKHGVQKKARKIKHFSFFPSVNKYDAQNVYQNQTITYKQNKNVHTATN